MNAPLERISESKCTRRAYVPLGTKTEILIYSVLNSLVTAHFKIQFSRGSYLTQYEHYEDDPTHASWRITSKINSVSCGEKGAFGLCWWECQVVPHRGEEYGGLLRKPNVELPYDLAVPPGYFSEGNKNTNSKPTCPSVFAAALSPVAKIRKQPKCPHRREKMRRMSSGILLSHNKGNLCGTTGMAVEGIMRNETRQRKTDTVSNHLFVGSKN